MLVIIIKIRTCWSKNKLQVINQCLLLWQCGEGIFEESHERHSQSLLATRKVFPGPHEGHGCVGSFTGIYGSQVLLCGQRGTSGKAQPCLSAHFTSATPAYAAALSSKQLPQEKGGGTENAGLCTWISTREAPDRALLFKAIVQMQPVSPHNGVFTL